MAHEMTLADGDRSLGVVVFPWCFKLRSVFKSVIRRMNPPGRKSSTRGVLARRSSNTSRQRVSWSGSYASFACRQQQQQQQQKKKIKNKKNKSKKEKSSGSGGLWSLRGYRKLSNSDEAPQESSRVSSKTTSSFSFKNDEAAEFVLDSREKIFQQQQRQQEQRQQLDLKCGVDIRDEVADHDHCDGMDSKLLSRWDEVVEMVLADSFEDLVDLEEFLGYYMLLECPVFRSMVHRFFSEFCREFCEDEELHPVVSLFVPEMQDFPSFGSSSGLEIERLPPSPCSRLQEKI